MTATPLFEARHIHKRFGDQVVLEEINLAFMQGELCGIMGPNGAGKTTCFNVLTGHYKPDRGQVIFDGEDITGLPPRVIAQKGVSRSFQLINLFDEYTALENVLIAVPQVRDRGYNMIRDVEKDNVAIDQAVSVLKQVGLNGKELEPSKRLSYGDRRALEIAVALATEPRILFLDEPTSGMGSNIMGRLADLVRELKCHYTMVIIEHDMKFLFDLADRISVVHWGQVIAEGTPDELRANKWVQASNLGKLV
ncbi:MAG TPA: ABC transporter ATP-binding protein [Deltaproteobacteria bacterium]|nr:ABC transporter ATP-binding protein [Deltaproteobacteria bacterium]